MSGREEKKGDGGSGRGDKQQARQQDGGARSQSDDGSGGDGGQWARQQDGSARGLDLNRASPEELERVRGVGPERAQRLAENRPYRSWEDVERVEGFSHALVEDLKSAGVTLGSERGAERSAER
jgi:hypothetical protein